MQYDVQSCAHSEFLMQIHSYFLFLVVMCYCETNQIDAGIYFVGYFQKIFKTKEFNLLDNVTQQNSKRLMQVGIEKIGVLKSCCNYIFYLVMCKRVVIQVSLEDKFKICI